MTKRRRYDAVKRALDLLVAAVAVIALGPILAVAAVAVALALGHPVLFRQERPGRDAKIFTLLKFRTMRPVDPAKSWVSDRDRLTRFGRFLRASSIDELPALWNVIRGDMSIVGPRPLHVRYLPRYSPTQARRHEVRPGITGLAQVMGRNDVTWADRLAHDVEYVDNRSLLLDLRIILKTVAIVLGRKGISAPGHDTMPEFQGTEVVE